MTRPFEQRTLWQSNAAPAPRTTRPDPAARLDVAVIGAGFTGLTCAWHLARRGARVAVFDAHAIGAGASGRNAGFVVPNFAKADPAAVIARLGEERGRRLLAAVGAGADRVFATIRDHALACDAEPVGWLHLAHSSAALDMLAGRVEAWRALGRPLRLLGADEARWLSGARHCVGALLDPSGGTIHPLDYVRGLARLALAAGAAIHEGAPVARVERSGSAWALGVGRERIVADRVVLATNAASDGVARLLNRAIVPLTVYQIATAPLPRAVVARIAPGRHPVADTRAKLFTYRLDRDDRLVSGGMAVFPVGARARMGRMIARRLAAELDLAAVPDIAHAWSGTAAMTLDFLPRLFSFGPGFFGGVGCNGRGIAMTAMLGEILADAASGAAPDTLPLPVSAGRPLPFRRIAGWAPSLAVAQARWRDRREGL